MKKITKLFILFLIGIIGIGALTSCKEDDNNEGEKENGIVEGEVPEGENPF